MPRILLLPALACAVLLAAPARAQAPVVPTPRLERIAEFRHQATGVAIGRDGRIFVNFPRWTEDTPISVGEVTRGGLLVPYPDVAWNAWRNARRDELAATERWVCVQAVTTDAQGDLWVLDSGAPALDRVVPGAPKLVRIDTATNRVAQVVAFGADAAPQGSYLNDVRIAPDGRHAYITDSGARGALLVVHLASGTVRRVLDGHPSTQPEPGVVISIGGRELRRPDGRALRLAADGIALTRDGRHLYWQALTGRTLYRVETEALHRAVMQPDALPAIEVQDWGENGVADGLHIGRESGRLYIAAPQDDAVKLRDLSSPRNEPSILVQDDRLRWPDSFAEAPGGDIYVTTSRIQDSAFFDTSAPIMLSTQLWRLDFGPN